MTGRVPRSTSSALASGRVCIFSDAAHSGGSGTPRTSSVLLRYRVRVSASQGIRTLGVSGGCGRCDAGWRKGTTRTAGGAEAEDLGHELRRLALVADAHDGVIQLNVHRYSLTAPDTTTGHASCHCREVARRDLVAAHGLLCPPLLSPSLTVTPAGQPGRQPQRQMIKQCGVQHPKCIPSRLYAQDRSVSEAHRRSHITQFRLAASPRSLSLRQVDADQSHS